MAVLVEFECVLRLDVDDDDDDGDRCSGALVVPVPMLVRVVGMRVARPKSTNFTCWPPFTSMMFSSLMSRLSKQRKKK